MVGPEAIYLDNNASTLTDPEVVNAVTAAMRDLYANSSSQHVPGSRAAAAIERARERIAALVSCPPRAVIFTSGATEADGLALCGLWAGSRLVGSHRDTIVVGSTEHVAVLESARSLERQGARVLLAPVDRDGIIDLEALQQLVDDRVLLVSVMAANSETGTIAPLDDVLAIAKSKDAAQIVGRLPFTVDDMDLVSVSAHKIARPKRGWCPHCQA